MNRVDAGNKLFPIFLKLDQIQTLVVGGGNVGLEKVEALVKNDPLANIRVVAPFVLDDLRALATHHSNIKIKRRHFLHADLKQIDLLILATDDFELHQKVKQLANQRNILVNVADTPSLCDFYLGSTVKKGDLKIGISTNGKSPTFAKRLREVLEEALPDDTPELLNKLKSIRDQLKGDFKSKVEKLNEITSVLVSK
jgi:siroheme synthase-like protein